MAALIAALILDLVFHSENEILTEIISLLFFLQFVPLVAETGNRVFGRRLRCVYGAGE